MTAFNAVRFRVKPGRDEEFLDAHRSAERNWPGLRRASLIKTGGYRPDYHSLETSATVVFPWDRHILSDDGTIVGNPAYAGLSDSPG